MHETAIFPTTVFQTLTAPYRSWQRPWIHLLGPNLYRHLASVPSSGQVIPYFWGVKSTATYIVSTRVVTEPRWTTPHFAQLRVPL